MSILMWKYQLFAKHPNNEIIKKAKGFFSKPYC